MNVRCLNSGRGDAAWNMAVDEALWTLSRDPVLRFYQWEQPCFSIGYFSDPPARGMSFVRRLTGGGVVDHTDDLTYSLFCPSGCVPATLSAIESYREIHESVVAAYRSCGMDAVLADGCSSEKTGICFEGYSRFDVLRAGEKVAGGAQRRGRSGLLHQGSIVRKGLPHGFERKMQEAFAKRFGWELSEGILTEGEQEAAGRLCRAKYGLSEWNEGRGRPVKRILS